MDRPGAGPPYETPLVSSRTLRTAVSSVGSSRLPLRLRHNAATPSEPQTVGRSSLLRRPSSSDLAGSYGNAPATVSRLPMRRPSLSNGSQMDPPLSARPDSRISSLKRRPSAADLQQESETASLKRQLARALSQVEEFKHAAERQKLEAAMAADKAQSQMNEYSARIEKLERHRAILLGKEREAAEREQRRKEDEDGAKEKLEKEVRSLRSQLDTLKDEHIDLQESFTDLEHSANQAIAQANHHQARTTALQQELELVRQESEERLRSATEEKKQRLALEAELERERLRAKDSGDSAVIREELHRQVSTLRTLEKENGKLQRKVETYERQHANIELLKETNRSLERKVKAAEELRQQLAGQAVELELLRREKADWSAFVKPEDTDTFSSPRKITKNLAATRIENATLRDRLNTHELELQRRDRIIGQLEAKAVELEKQLQQAAKELDAAKEKARVDGAQVGLLRQEVAMLKRHLDSYVTEEANHNAGNYDAQKTARLAELEELLEAHKREVASLTQQVSHWRGLVERYGGNTTEILELEEREKREAASEGAVSKSLEEQLRLNEELQRELDEARNELALMEQELEALSTQVEQLEENQGIRGAYNPETTKVLEFRDSPDRVEHAIRTATLERLKNENQALLRRLGDMERGALAQQGAGVQQLVPRESLVSAQAEADKLKALVQQKETMLKRIGQAVAEKTEAMRLAVQKLLGFQLSFLESGRIRVTSVYAPSKDRSLAFDPWPGGPMPFKLVSATDEKVMSIDEVRRSIGFWLDGRQSLPGFMASLTMALYEETTSGQAGGVVFG
ncbi:Spindle assembly checkpoint component MAD1 [Rhodotorula toruloides]|nr:Spindle assembly checkpoint component MAD1 [Rhodotorula toruloides]